MFSNIFQIQRDGPVDWQIRESIWIALIIRGGFELNNFWIFCPIYFSKVFKSSVLGFLTYIFFSIFTNKLFVAIETATPSSGFSIRPWSGPFGAVWYGSRQGFPTIPGVSQGCRTSDPLHNPRSAGHRPCYLGPVNLLPDPLHAGYATAIDPPMCLPLELPPSQG